MLKSYIFVAVALFFALSAQAQPSNSFWAKPAENNSYLGVSAGRSVPKGDFAGTQKENHHHGFASDGYFLDLNYGYKIFKWVGLAATLRHHQSENNTGGFAGSGMSATVIHAAAKGWATTSLMAGIKGFVPVGVANITLEPQALLGPVLAKSNGALVNGAGEWVEYEERKSYCLGYALGATVSYDISNRVRFSVSADVLAANPVFKDSTYIDYSHNYRKERFRQPYVTVNYGVGLAYRFTQKVPQKSLLWFPVL